MAIASLCCSLASISVVVTSVLGVIFGHIALRQIRADPTQRGRGMALAGVIIGWVVVGAVVATIILAIILAARE